ncbi:MAG: class I SAM-dependent methyltransferase [Halodesulfurarchaeum sp.]|nr:class I SAM-dependent methyltransferase [Halodesulfurarchaeum sp.]
MMAHTFDPGSASSLEDLDRFRYLSRDELVASLDVQSDSTVADIGSGTGFYTREVAPFVGELYAVDLQDEMHDKFAEHQIPSNVELVLSPAASLPFDTGTIDAVFSTMTFHEVSAAAPAEFDRVLGPGGRLVIADWSRAGAGERGPPVGERTNADGAAKALEAVGFTIESTSERPETFMLEATSS